jgi:hypothetical protein
MKNIFGHTPQPQLCGVCQASQQVFMPDNRTEVPCCKACWTQVPVHIRLQVLTTARQASTWEHLVQILDGWLDERLADRMAEKERHRDTWGGN